MLAKGATDVINVYRWAMITVVYLHSNIYQKIGYSLQSQAMIKFLLC